MSIFLVFDSNLFMISRRNFLCSADADACGCELFLLYLRLRV